MPTFVSIIVSGKDLLKNSKFQALNSNRGKYYIGVGSIIIDRFTYDGWQINYNSTALS